MEPLVSLDDFGDLLGDEFDASDPKPARVLDMASTFVRAATNELFTASTEDVTLRGTWDDELHLPRPPVTDVSLVEVRGDGESVFSILAAAGDGGFVELDSNAYTWDRFGLLFRSGGWGGTRGIVHVVYERGSDEVPQDIQDLTLSQAKRLMVYASRFSDEQLQSAAPDVGFTELEAAIVRKYNPLWGLS